MKRLLLLACATVVLLVAFAPPTQATEYGQVCNSYFNNAGGKGLKVCVSVVNTGNQPVWTRVELIHINGYNEPSQVRLQIRLYSRTGNSSQYCYNVCGANDADTYFDDATGDPAPAEINGAHIDGFYIRCMVHANVTGGIWWTDTGTGDAVNMNSAERNLDNLSSHPCNDNNTTYG